MVWAGSHTDKHNPLLHLGFWASWIVFFSLLQSLGQSGSSMYNWLLYYLFTLPVFVFHTYLIAYWLVPQTFMKGYYLTFVAGLIVFLFVFSLIELIISYEWLYGMLQITEVTSTSYLSVKNIIISGIGNHYIILVFMAIKAGRAWYHARTVEEEEQQRKNETAIEIYNYQLQPRIMLHLMNLLGAAIKKDQKKSPDLIIQISGFLNLFLNENNMGRMSFPEEVRLIEMYFKIFTTALPDDFRTEFSSEGDFSSFSAPDFLFLPVVDYYFNLCRRFSNSCNYSVKVSELDRKLFFSLNFSSESKIHPEKNPDLEMLAKRLRKNFSGAVTVEEERSDNCWKLNAVVF